MKYDDEGEPVAEESAMDSIDQAKQHTMALTEYILVN